MKYTIDYYGKTKKAAERRAISDKGLIWSGVSARQVKVIPGKLISKNRKVGFSKQRMNKYRFRFVTRR